MPATVGKRSSKAGLPPGSVVHVGRKGARATAVSVLRYHEQGCDEAPYAPGAALPDPDAADRVTWIEVTGLESVELLEAIGRHFRVHPLVLEDIVNTEQRPKVEDYGDFLYVVLKTFDRDGRGGRLDADQVSLVLGRNFVLSFTESDGRGFGAVKERLRAGRGPLRRLGADHLLYSLLDAVVDSYFGLLEGLDDRVEALETALAAPRPKANVLHEVHALRRDGILVRRALWPLRELVNGLQRRDSPLIRAETLFYLRDVYDHTVHIIESLETLRDLIAELLELHLSAVSYRISVVIKILTVITTVFMPLSLIAGIYGMNFRFMPGLDSPLGFFAVLALMLAISTGMLWLFRRRGWL